MCLRFYNEKNANMCLCFSFYIKKKEKRRRVVYILNFLLFCSHLTYLFTLYDFYKERKIYERNTTFGCVFPLRKTRIQTKLCYIRDFPTLRYGYDFISCLEMLKQKKKKKLE